MDELNYQIQRIAPSEGWFGAAWQTHSVSRKGIPFWDSACFSDIIAFIAALRAYPSALNVKNLYMAHATFKQPDCSKRRNPPQLDRHARNLLTSRTLAIDGDVKPGAFASTAECKQTVCAMLAEIGLKPSFIVLTSATLDPSLPATTSGMHFYLTMTRSPSLEDRKAMTDDLIAALKHRGLVFDTGVTTDAVRVLRSVGSLNRKTDEIRIARLDLESIDGPDYDPDKLKLLLARHRPPGREHNNPPPDKSAHVDLAEVASAAVYLLDHGHYGPGCYFHLRDLFFGLAQLAHERPELHDGARSLFERIAIATGRDHAKAMTWFDGAVDRAPGYADQNRVTLASTFRYARQAGWRSPHDIGALNSSQATLFTGAMTMIEECLRAKPPLVARAKRLVAQEGDRAVRSHLARRLAARLTHRSLMNDALDALGLIDGVRPVAAPAWLARYVKAGNGHG